MKKLLSVICLLMLAMSSQSFAQSQFALPGDNGFATMHYWRVKMSGLMTQQFGNSITQFSHGSNAGFSFDIQNNLTHYLDIVAKVSIPGFAADKGVGAEAGDQYFDRYGKVGLGLQLDILNLTKGFDFGRFCSPYVAIGAGIPCATDNGNVYFEGGVGLDLRITNDVHLHAEYLVDHFGTLTHGLFGFGATFHTYQN